MVWQNYTQKGMVWLGFYLSLMCIDLERQRRHLWFCDIKWWWHSGKCLKRKSVSMVSVFFVDSYSESEATVMKSEGEIE